MDHLRLLTGDTDVPNTIHTEITSFLSPDLALVRRNEHLRPKYASKKKPVMPEKENQICLKSIYYYVFQIDRQGS